MAKNIVVLCDGTGNEIETDLTNVLKLFRVVRKNEAQIVYYNPGVGTLGQRDSWAILRQRARAVFGLATAYGLDADILGAYRFIAGNWADGDRIYLFGFSRGAYTVRVVAALINMIGLLPPAQLNLAGYALAAYKQLGEIDDDDRAEKAAFQSVWRFARIAEGRPARIHFVGVWDTVSSVLVPRPDRFYVPSLQTLPYTRRNPCVRTFRHAMAIDERRRMFRLNRWHAPQDFVANPYDPKGSAVPQDIEQVWFPGVHGDVGGNYAEADSGLSKFPLRWMLAEATAHGLLVQRSRAARIVEGQKPDRDWQYVAPDAAGPHHDLMTAAWRALEYLPKRVRWREWTDRDELSRLVPALGRAAGHRPVGPRASGRDRPSAARPDLSAGQPAADLHCGRLTPVPGAGCRPGSGTVSRRRKWKGSRMVRTGVMICGHGSRDAAACDEFRILTGRIAAALPDTPVEMGYLEFARPIIREGLDALRAKGVNRVLAVPGMLFAAGHVKNDVPSVLNTYAAENGIDIEMGRDLGIDPRLLAAARDRIEEALAGRPEVAREDTLLLVIGRGTSDSDANGNVAKVARMLWEGMGFGHAEIGFSGVAHPRTEVALERATRLGLPPHRRLPLLPLHGRAGAPDLRGGRHRGGPPPADRDRPGALSQRPSSGGRDLPRSHRRHRDRRHRHELRLLQVPGAGDRLRARPGRTPGEPSPPCRGHRHRRPPPSSRPRPPSSWPRQRP